MSITAWEAEEIAQANASGKPVVVFVHGLWLLPSSWAPWRERFEARGYATVAPGWPDDPRTVDEARKAPDVFAGKTIGQIAAHLAEVVGGLTRKPAIVGHSFGGFFAQHLAGKGLSSATVAIDPAPFRGVLPLPISTLRASQPVLGNPFNKGRAITLTLDEYRYGWANALDDAEAKSLHERTHVAAPAMPLFQAAFANVNPWTEATVDAANPARGPLKLISGEKDNTVPWAMVNAAFAIQKRNAGVTEIEEIKGRGHSLVIDAGWAEVADNALAFVEKHFPPAT